MNKDEIIYQIYRSCRLCGAGAGYKMPIIQSVIDLDGIDIELKQKIRDCVEIEVTHNDRMPPLICELCVDKIHDFYEFRIMCQDTDKRTRLRLGLPLQTKSQNVPNPEECNLGNTKPVVVNSDSDEGEPLSTHQTIAPVKTKPKLKSAKMRNEPVKIKIQNFQPAFDHKNRSSSPEIFERRETRGKAAPPPKRPSRQSKTTDEWSLSDLQGLQVQRASPRAGPKPSFKSNIERQKEIERERERESEEKTEENTLLALKRKRPLFKEVVETPSPPAKKAKPAPEPAPKQETSKPGPKSSKVPKPTPPSKPTQKPPPKAGPKSRKRNPSPSPPPLPIPKPKKPEDPELPTNSRWKKPEDSLSPATSRSKGPEESALPTNWRSKKQELPVMPTTKSKKAEHRVPGPTSKAKKPDTPAPKCKKGEPSPPPKVLARSMPSPHKSLTCVICKCKTKTAQGLASHKKSHVVGFTPLTLSCNPCELWFPTLEEAASHHRQHSVQEQPYTCNKCYDDFCTLSDYDLHLTRNQCLPTYEVPDVKCDDCWKYFPTYKLLEDHKCQGEGGRPGGKCEKCQRSYNLQKHLIAHEMRCVSRKKGEPVNPDISSKMLPVQVRIAKCDSLLRNGNDGRYNVFGLSHRFGLDNNFSYPYLYSMGDIGMKSNISTSFDHMVAIKDEIKNEYLNNEDSYVHWDSDESDESVKSGDLFSYSAKIKPVDTLSNLSIKTIFSPKYLGKVPRKKRKDAKGFASILSIDFHRDMKSNIESIIDNLGDESKNSDNHDSDSILDKNRLDRVDSNANVDLFDRLKTSLAIDMVSTVETVENYPVGECVRKDDINDTISNKVEDSNNEERLNKLHENNTQNGSNENSRIVQIYNQDDKDEDTIGTNAESNENAKLCSPQKSTGSNKAPKNRDLDQKAAVNPVVSANNEKNGLIVSTEIDNEKESLPTGDKVENTSESEEPGKMDVDDQIEQKLTHIQTRYRNIEISELENEKSFSTCNITNSEKKDSQSCDTINHKPADNLNNEKEDSQSSEAISFKGEDDLNNDKDDSQSSDAISYEPIDNLNDEKEESHPSEAISFKAEDDLHNDKDDSQSSDAISYKPVDDLNNEKDDSQSSEAISFKEEDDLNNEKDDSQSSFVANDTTNNFNDTENADTQSSVSINEETITNSISLKDNIFTGVDSNDKSIHSNDRFNINNLNDEERQLMAELDAQIGENESKTNAIGPSNPASDVNDKNDSTRAVIGGESFSDVTSLDALIQKQNADLRSLDLDSISDEEFNFDL